MQSTLYRLAAVMATISSFAFFTSHAQSSAFVAWEVSGVAFGDTLNVRKYPANGSQKQSAYPNGTVLQMTGKCTGGVDLFDISQKPVPQQRQAVRYRWCQIWHDPAQNGNFTTGWVYGKFIKPH